MKFYNSIDTVHNNHPRVVHLTSAHRSNDIRIFIKECRTLARAGYRVDLVAPGLKDELRDNINIHAFPAAKRRFSRMTTGVYQVYKIAKSLNADIYHFHTPDLIPVGLLLLRRGKQVIYDVQEDHPRSVLSREYLPRIVRKPISLLFEMFEKYAAKYFPAIVSATPAIGERFQKINQNVVVVNNYPILNEFKPDRSLRWDERDISVCYLGAITYIRGAVQMIQAMEYLPNSMGAKLELAGEIWPDELRTQVMGLKGWQSVKDLGILSREEVKSLLARTRAGLVLIHPEPNHLKAQPNKLFEYMSAGIPVIASDFPLWRQIVEKSGCGLLVNPLDVLSIADAIRTILTHNDEAEEMGKRGRETVESKFNWSNEEAKLLSLYEKLSS